MLGPSSRSAGGGTITQVNCIYLTATKCFYFSNFPQREPSCFYALIGGNTSEIAITSRMYFSSVCKSFQEVHDSLRFLWVSVCKEAVITE